jgi:soluble cytochrome b562
MRTPRLTTLALGCFVLVGLALGASSAARQDHPTPADAPKSAPELGEAMKRIEGAMKTLRRSVRDAEQRPASLEALDELQGAVVDAKRRVPPMALPLEAAQKEELVLAYRRAMGELLEQSLVLERAVLDGDVERARAEWTKLQDMEDSGHERFAPAD